MRYLRSLKSAITVCAVTAMLAFGGRCSVDVPKDLTDKLDQIGAGCNNPTRKDTFACMDPKTAIEIMQEFGKKQSDRTPESKPPAENVCNEPSVVTENEIKTISPSGTEITELVTLIIEDCDLGIKETYILEFDKPLTPEIEGTKIEVPYRTEGFSLGSLVETTDVVVETIANSLLVVRQTWEIDAALNNGGLMASDFYQLDNKITLTIGYYEQDDSSSMYIGVNVWKTDNSPYGFISIGYEETSINLSGGLNLSDININGFSLSLKARVNDGKVDLKITIKGEAQVIKDGSKFRGFDVSFIRDLEARITGAEFTE